jgi:hypothetical protein
MTRLRRQVDLVVLGEALAKGLDAVVADKYARFFNLRIDEQKIPKSLKDVEQEALFAIEKP